MIFEAVFLLAAQDIEVTASRASIPDYMPDHPCFHAATIRTDAHGEMGATIFKDERGQEKVDLLRSGALVVVCGSPLTDQSRYWIVYPAQDQAWSDCKLKSAIASIGEYRGLCKSGWTRDLKALSEEAHEKS